METRSSANSSDTRPLLPKPPITIVILTWNALDYTKGCLESLRANTDYPDYRVIVFCFFFFSEMFLNKRRGCVDPPGANTDYPDYRVIVADNGSSDGTIEY